MKSLYGLFNTSKFISGIKRFDISDEHFSAAVFGSAFYKFKKFIFNIFKEYSKNSIFIKYIDYIILFFITLLFILITFASTKIIGLIAVSTAILSLVRVLLTETISKKVSSVNIPVLLYFLIAAVSVGFSSYFMPSVKGYIKMIVYLGSYFSFYTMLKDHPKRSIYMLCLLAFITSFESLYAVFQNFVGVDALATWQDKTGVNFEQLITRVYGSLQPYNPNLLGGFLVGGFSSLLTLSAINLHKKNIRYSIYSLTGLFISAIAIVFTGSRGAYIALAAMVFLTFLISGHIILNDFKEKLGLKKVWVYSILFIVATVLTIIIVSPAIQHRIASIFTLRGDSSNSFRLNVYISGFKMFLDNWLIGIGPGNHTFRLTYGLYMVTGFDALSAYNIFLEIAIESGILALFSFLWLILISFIKGVKNIFSDICFENKVIISGCLIALTGMTVHGLVDTIWYRPQVQLIFWLYIAMLATETRRD